MAADVLGPTVHNDVGSPAERVLQRRRRERAVDAEVRAARVRDVGVVLDVEGFAEGVYWCLEPEEIARVQVRRVAVEWKLLCAREALVEFEDAVAAVVAVADGDGLGVEEGEEAVEGREAGGVRYAGCFEERGEDGFEAGCVGCGVAGVDMLLVAVGVRLVEGLEAGGVFGVTVRGRDVNGRRDILDHV